MTGCIYCNKYTYLALMLFIMACMMLEFFRMTMGKKYFFSQIITIFAGASLFVLTFSYKGFHLPGRLVILALVPIFLVMINSLYVRDKTDFGIFANLYTGILYIAAPLTLLNFAVFNRAGEYSGVFLLCLFAIVFASDIGAYVFGMALGQKYGKKLFPSISPKKSWIGFWGGMFTSVLVAVVLYLLQWLHFSLLQTIILAIIMTVAGVYGDLFESQWKRHYELKDSGKIIPGHGGLLDRFDSTLFAIPAGVIYLVILNIF